MAGGVRSFYDSLCSVPSSLSTDHVDDDETMTEAEIDELFARTQPIGNALNALAQAELAAAAVDELPPEHQARLDQVLANVLDEIQRPGD